MSETFRYVLHEQVPAFAAQGWIAHASLDGTHHGQYSTLMEYVGSSRTAHGANMRPGSHYAPVQTRRDSFSLPSALPLWPPGRTLSGQENESASFHASGASFERSNFVQSILDILAVFVCLALIFATGTGIAFSLFVLFFVGGI